MNYRHGFHAGNFADVFKHAILTRVLVHLGAKAAPYFVLDTHAGAGSYDLAETAERSGEYRAGIERLLAAKLEAKTTELLAPYLDIVRAMNSGGATRFYPGSPQIALALSRPQDRLTFCEKQPDEFAALSKTAGRDTRAKAREMDGWEALKALLPPNERRGVVLIDPPFEQPGEFRQIASSIEEAMKRFATGIYLVWYPIKNRHDTDVALRRIVKSAGRQALRIELEVAPPKADDPLTACGLLAFNPPWKLEEECTALLPALIETLGRDGKAASRLDHVT